MAYHFNITDMTGNTEQDHIDASLTWFCAWTLGFIKVDNHTAHDFPLCGFDPAVMQYINFLLSKFKTFPWKPHLNIWLILSLQFHVCFKIWFADSCRFLCDQCSPHPLIYHWNLWVVNYSLLLLLRALEMINSDDHIDLV